MILAVLITSLVHLMYTNGKFIFDDSSLKLTNAIIERINSMQLSWTAVSTASAFSDRICVASKQAINKHYSAEDILTCCKTCYDNDDHDGCQGGYMENALDFLMMHGICTGGDYGSNEGCKPYSIAPCILTKNKSCDYEETAKQCQKRCTNQKYSRIYHKDKYFGKKRIEIYNNTEAVQKLMKLTGSMTAVFKLYEDFKHYKSGVYYHVLGKFLGWHAVRVIGWGSENNQKYWLAANSWNSSWGNKDEYTKNLKEMYSINLET